MPNFNKAPDIQATGTREEDIAYSGGFSAEQMATADRLLGLSNNAEQAEPVPPTAEELAEAARTERAEKNAEMMANLLTKKITATMTGDAAAEAKYDGMIAELEKRM